MDVLQKRAGYEFHWDTLLVMDAPQVTYQAPHFTGRQERSWVCGNQQGSLVSIAAG